MPRPLVALLLVTAALFAGCGGTDIAYTEVESPPAELPLPDGDAGTTAPADTTATDDNVKTRKSTTTPAPVDSTTTTTTEPVDPATTTATEPVVPVTEEPEPVVEDDTGAAAPPTEEPVTEEPADPADDTGGAVAGGASDQFCADNPGAC